MRLTLKTKGFTDIINITEEIGLKIKESGVEEGICSLSCPGSTCALTTIEYEEGAVNDLKRVLEEIAPVSKEYEHCKKWGDCNGYAHVRSALLKPFLVVPIEQGKMILGAWQQIIFIDFDNKPRQREIIVKIIS